MSSADQVTNNALGEPLAIKSKVLETGAAMSQNFGPMKQICAHLNAFHTYASDPSRCVEANHYCSHLNEDVRQCLIYDTHEPNARLIGVEYLISATLYKTLDTEERQLWHSHVFEIKSGMLIMPGPNGLPTGIWEEAETKEMEDLIGLYGKIYHFWQVDRGDKLPLGQPQLMVTYTGEGQYPPGLKELIGKRDKIFGIDSEAKKEKRAHIAEPKIHEDADSVWRRSPDSGKK